MNKNDVPQNLEEVFIQFINGAISNLDLANATRHGLVLALEYLDKCYQHKEHDPSEEYSLYPINIYTSKHPMIIPIKTIRGDRTNYLEKTVEHINGFHQMLFVRTFEQYELFLRDICSLLIFYDKSLAEKLSVNKKYPTNQNSSIDECRQAISKTGKLNDASNICCKLRLLFPEMATHEKKPMDLSNGQICGASSWHFEWNMKYIERLRHIIVHDSARIRDIAEFHNNITMSLGLPNNKEFCEFLKEKKDLYFKLESSNFTISFLQSDFKNQNFNHAFKIAINCIMSHAHMVFYEVNKYFSEGYESTAPVDTGA